HHTRPSPQCAFQPSRAIGGGTTCHVEQPPPVDLAVWRDRSETYQVGKDGQRIILTVDAVAMPNLSMPVAVRGVGELERDVGSSGRPIVAAVSRKKRRREIAANQPRQKLLQYDGLVVPAQLAHRRVEHPIG